MVMRYGMVKSARPRRLRGASARRFLGDDLSPRNREYSEETAREIDVAVREIVKAPTTRRSRSSRARSALLERGAQQLLEKETLAEVELDELRRGMGLEKAA